LATRPITALTTDGETWPFPSHFAPLALLGPIVALTTEITTRAGGGFAGMGSWRVIGGRAPPSVEHWQGARPVPFALQTWAPCPPPTQAHAALAPGVQVGVVLEEQLAAKRIAASAALGIFGI
jgi:hypothetical protein